MEFVFLGEEGAETWFCSQLVVGKDYTVMGAISCH